MHFYQAGMLRLCRACLVHKRMFAIGITLRELLLQMSRRVMLGAGKAD
jgi:hypothetical protein